MHEHFKHLRAVNFVLAVTSVALIVFAGMRSDEALQSRLAEIQSVITVLERGGTQQFENRLLHRAIRDTARNDDIHPSLPRPIPLSNAVPGHVESMYSVYLRVKDLDRAEHALEAWGRAPRPYNTAKSFMRKAQESGDGFCFAFCFPRLEPGNRYFDADFEPLSVDYSLAKLKSVWNDYALRRPIWQISEHLPVIEVKRLGTWQILPADDGGVEVLRAGVKPSVSYPLAYGRYQRASDGFYITASAIDWQLQLLNAEGLRAHFWEGYGIHVGNELNPILTEVVDDVERIMGVEWRPVRFSEAFPALSAVESDLDDFNLRQLRKLTEYEIRNGSGELRILGNSVAASAAWLVGPLVLMAIQLYFLLHLTNCRTSEVDSFPWIGVYPGSAPNAMLTFSVCILPFVATLTLIGIPSTLSRALVVLAVGLGCCYVFKGVRIFRRRLASDAAQAAALSPQSSGSLADLQRVGERTDCREGTEGHHTAGEVGEPSSG